MRGVSPRLRVVSEWRDSVGYRPLGSIPGVASARMEIELASCRPVKVEFGVDNGRAAIGSGRGATEAETIARPRGEPAFFDMAQSLADAGPTLARPGSIERCQLACIGIPCIPRSVVDDMRSFADS